MEWGVGAMDGVGAQGAEWGAEVGAGRRRGGVRRGRCEAQRWLVQRWARRLDGCAWRREGYCQGAW